METRYLGRTGPGSKLRHCVLQQLRRPASGALDIGNMSSMAPRGTRTCIAVIQVTQGYGGMTVWTGNSNVKDFIEPAIRTLKRLSFELRTARGDLVNLQGGHWTAVFAIGPRLV